MLLYIHNNEGNIKENKTNKESIIKWPDPTSDLKCHFIKCHLLKAGVVFPSAKRIGGMATIRY